MAYKINEECMACGSCEPECPNNAITGGSSRFLINPDKCTECVGIYKTSRCAEVCPFGAPVLDPVHKESQAKLLAKWKKLHPGEP